SKAYSKRTETIEIMEFVESGEIDSKYYEKPYYLEPEKGADKVYSLLVEALRKSNKVGVARFVLRDLEHLGVLKEENGILIINQMRYVSEIRKPGELNIPDKQKIAKPELDMAIQLIDQLSKPFEPGKHKDTYSEVLKKAIKSKATSNTKKVMEAGSGPAEVVDLLSKLRQSLKNAKDKENVS
ncbi:Ku protein, partial [Actinomycetota bacterium]